FAKEHGMMNSASETACPVTSQSTAAPPPAQSLVKKKRRRLVFVLALASLLVALLLGRWLGGGPTAERPVTYQVHREKLQRAITARGELEPAETSEIICRVRSRTPGRNASTSIKWVVEDGSKVEKGQVLIELDDAALQDELQASHGPLEVSKSEWILAEKNLEIVRSQNETDIK